MITSPSRSGCGAMLRVRLRAGYGDRTILNDVAFDLEAGQALGLVGTSGSGKSTLVLSLLGLLPWRRGWSKGEVFFEKQNLLLMREREIRSFRGKRLALVPQSPLSALNGAVSLRSHFEQAWKAHDQRGRRFLDERLSELLPSVHLPLEPAFLASRPGEISVGQAQRITIALALLHRPAVLIADEPTSALDPVTQHEVLRLLRKLTRETGTALLYISHDLLSVLNLCDQLAVLAGGTIVENIPVTDLGSRSHDPALAALLKALPLPPQALLAYRPERQSFRESLLEEGVLAHQ